MKELYNGTGDIVKKVLLDSCKTLTERERQNL